MMSSSRFMLQVFTTADCGFFVFQERVAAVAAKVGAVAKCSEKALVKRFCEKNFTEFLLDLKKWSAFFYLPPLPR